MHWDKDTLMITSTSLPTPTYQWKMNDTLIIGNQSYFFIDSITSADSNKYSCIVTNACGDSILNFPIHVNKYPIIVGGTKDTTICQGDTINFTVNAGGTNQSYQWTKGGDNISGGTNSTFTINQANINDYDFYSCKVSNGCGATSLKTFTLTVNAPPVINATPLNQYVNLGDSVYFSLSPVGTPPFTYQWFLNGDSIKGATNFSLKIEPIVYGDSGTYTCKVSNICGNISVYVSQIHVFSINLTGQVKYDNTSGTGLCKSEVQLRNYENTIKDSAETDSLGNFEFEYLNIGNYILTAKTNLIWGGGNPLDALLVNRYYIGAIKSFSDELKKTAADVNNDGKINPLDALLINRRYIGIVKKFQSGDWVFQKDSLNLKESISNNIKGICVGDVNASYNVPVCVDKRIDVTPGHGFNQDVVSLADSCMLKLDSLVAKPGDTVRFALWIKDSTKTGAWGARIQIDTNVLTFIDTLLNIDDTLNNTGRGGVCEGAGYNKPGMDNTVNSNFYSMKNKRLLNLEFIYNGGETALTFLPGSMVGNDSLQEDNVTFLNGNIGPLYLTSQPAGSLVCPGSRTQFTVGAVGDSTGVEYQWITSIIENGKLKIENLTDSGVFTGTNTGTLNISDVTGMDSVQFRCIVSNGYGSVTSRDAMLTVNEAPIINNQTGDTTLCSGASTSFSVMATGTEPLSYVWLKNGNVLMEDGMYSDSMNILILNSISVNDSGVYRCIVSNLCGSVTSDSAQLTVNSPIVINKEPENIVQCKGRLHSSIYQ